MTEHLVYVGGPKEANDETGETGRRPLTMPHEVIAVKGHPEGRYVRTAETREGYTVYRWKKGT